MGKRAHVKTGFLYLAVALFSAAVLIFVAVSCDFFAPPFVFDNPYDPQQEFNSLGSIGRPIYSEGGGLVRPQRIAVVHGEFVVTPATERGRITRHFFGTNTYDALSVAGSGDDYTPYIRDVCIVEGGREIYVAGWRGIHRIDQATGAVTRYWVRYDEHEFMRLAPDPTGGVWALSFRRLQNGDERLRIFHFSPGGSTLFHREYPEFTNVHFWDWDIAVSNTIVAVSRHHDVLYFDRVGEDLSTEVRGRLVYDHDSDAYVLAPADSTFHGDLYIRGIAFNAATNQFVAVGRWWHPQDRFIAYLNSGTGEFIESLGTYEEMPGYEWQGVAVSGGHEYVSNAQTGRIVRVDDWQTVHENGDDPLGFSRIRGVAVDPFVEPALLYVVDDIGAIHMVDLETREFVGFFGSRGDEFGDIRNPRSIFFTSEAVYVAQHGNVFRYTRAGAFTGTVNDGGPGSFKFVIHDGYLVSTYYSEFGEGIYVRNLSSDESEVVDGVFPDTDVLLDTHAGDILAVYWDESERTVVIGRIDLSTFGFIETGRFADRELRLDHHDDVYLSGFATTPQGFLWVMTEAGFAVRADQSGTVYRTVRIDPDRHYHHYEGLTVDPNGRVYFGAGDRIDVYGAR
ncbi:MAG: hypothetical protein EA426_20195 [Spirochaetaceae bacterium]|nr:MAG: hypothetical protein EA426_20195 [Spirochaetaceae bacterium]